jgi:hypothetical protein
MSVALMLPRETEEKEIEVYFYLANPSREGLTVIV